ncbi:Eco57I restriction-modification methylase domain-containing protein [Akkermansia glycaniphila]|uniref:site-specific DNA-methyltransferase (adenine-specific) n=1 Tax=Akkermansia glycaniphila TaxID=1679444 RepID=A0A1H6MH52_9BACT|nr:class I SAM-dependent methyltransferase [Akkermansia glycaniphila]SEH97661.1 s-adenosyl-l-methionine-dependent methyltransferase [Akkermansia glycaniphila]
MSQQLKLTNSIDYKPISVSTSLRKKNLGQYMTPESIAHFMAAMFPDSFDRSCHLLDAGAGCGALTSAFLDRWKTGKFGFSAVNVTMYEIDALLRQQLHSQIANYPEANISVLECDYIMDSMNRLPHEETYSHVILNPPYKKINSHSTHRKALNAIGVEMVNLYSAFVALAILQTKHQGQIVAIIPRSFCNGPYYKAFRQLLLEHTTIKHIHLFKARNKAFQEDSVLQENIIIRLEKGSSPAMVRISSSTDASFDDLSYFDLPIERIVFPEDTEQFIHIPSSTEILNLESSESIKYSLQDLNIQISTGPVVDFRLKEHLCSMPCENTAPLLYPIHFRTNKLVWPLSDIRKPNAIKRNVDTEKWLYPTGFYCVVKRFSTKEEKRRIVARVIDPNVFKNMPPVLGFENHLNVFHQNKRGLPPELAYGLSTFLNSTELDEYFRRFNGHTQVNATDLRKLKYPSMDVLLQLGVWTMAQSSFEQSDIDLKITELTS